ncbi:MAG: rRNA maturation RNase YbeY [Peptococcia bacterium]
MEILLGNQQSKLEVTTELETIIHQLVSRAAKELELPQETEVSISFVDNDSIRQLNRDYRGIDRETDVLSFALDEEDQAGDIPFANGSGIQLLGDIIISLEKAQEQAFEYGHSLEREVGFLTIHGLLHLLGFNHEEPLETEKMRETEEMILQASGLGRR